MASSSSARKVAKLASRGRGKKVRFSGGTTFPTALTVVILLMVALIVYAKVSIPSAEKGHPEVGETWVAAYSLRVCDTEFKLTGTPDELVEALLEVRRQVPVPVEFVARSHLPLLEYDAQVEVMQQLAEGVAPHV